MAKHRKISIGVGVIVLHPDTKRYNPGGDKYKAAAKMLVTTRLKGSSWGEGAIAMPGGHVEEFEKTVDCAVRETLEETGLIVRPKLIDGHTYVVHAEEWFRQGRHHWTIYMAADVIGGVLANPEPTKHEDWRWETLDDLSKICRPDQDWIPIRALIANREKIGL